MYAPLPLLMWAAVRHGVNVVALCTATVALLAIIGVLRGQGPFATSAPEDAALAVQTFLIIAASSLLLLAASFSELRHTKSTARIERKLQELQMRKHQEQLAYLSRVSVMGELSGALAHELNQPLAAILLNAQAACHEIENSQPNLPEIAAALRDIVDDDRRAGEVIRKLRTLFMRGAIQAQPIAVNECIREVMTLQRSYLIVRRVTAEMHLCKQLPMVAADRVQLQQVLLNLIVNACDAMATNAPAQRRLRIETAPGRDGAVDIHIRDNGHGLEDVEKVFEPFFSTKDQGIGLGLAVSRTIIAAHGGRLWASRNQQRGMTFHISLPAAPDAYESAAGRNEHANGDLWQ
jgi:C4-dicarboxylate-specific signal transduction histidine kinase